MHVLLTGGADCVGSHAAKALARAGMVPVVFDNFHRGHRSAVRWGPVVEADLADRTALERVPIAEGTPQRDGTAVRDYIHVTDLAQGHLAALRLLGAGGKSGAFNLGTGEGRSVREVIAMVEKVSGRPVPSRPFPRRPGDPPILVADPAKAARELNWSPSLSSLETIIETAWKWHNRNDGRSPAKT